MSHTHEKVPFPLLIAEEEVLCILPGHWHSELIGLLAGEDRRVIEALVGDAVGFEKGVDIHDEVYGIQNVGEMQIFHIHKGHIPERFGQIKHELQFARHTNR